MCVCVCVCARARVRVSERERECGGGGGICFVFLSRHTAVCFGAYLYSADTQHDNLHEWRVTTGSVIAFIPRCHPRK